MNKRLEQKSFCEIEDRISSIIWDSKSSKNQLYATTWNGKLHTLQFNPRIWKIEMKKEPKQITESSLLSIDEDHNNTGKLLLGDDSGTVYSYNIETEKCAIMIQDKEYRPMSKVISVKGSSRIFTFSWDRTMQIWDTQSRKNVYTHTMRENIVIAEYMHPYIILVFGNNSMAFINAETYEKGSPIKEKLIEHDGLIRSLAVDTSKEYLALGDIQGNVQILKRKSTDNNISSTKDKLSYNDYSVELEYEAHFSKMPDRDGKPKEQKIVFPVNAICFNPKDSGFIISAGGDCSLSLLDTAVQNGNRKTQYFYQKEACQFQRPFTHLRFNEEGTVMLTIEVDHNMTEVLENPKCEYKATSTLRILKLVEDSSFE